MNLLAEVIQMLASVTYLPKFVSALQSALDETGTVPWPIVPVGVAPPPHPIIAADWSAYWSGSVLAGARQTGPIVLEKTTGASNVRMAMSLAYSKSKV